MIHTTSKTPTITADIFESRLTLTFANGESLEIETNSLDDRIKQAAMLHGLKQKLVDAAAIARNTETGRSATVEDKYAAVRAVHARLTSATPSWNVPKGEGGAAGSNLFIRALMQMTRKSRSEIDEFLGEKSKEQKAALRKNPRVASIMAELSAASGTGGIDTDALLDELTPSQPQAQAEVVGTVPGFTKRQRAPKVAKDPA